MAVGQLGTPRYAQYSERRDYANHPDGNEDVGNRAAKDWFTNFCAQHDYSTGLHATTGCVFSEAGTYTGNDADNRNIPLINTSLIINFLMIWRADTEFPVLVISEMDADDTKELETSAFQADMIQSIGTGTFQVGTDAAVNAAATTYYYLAVGTE